MAYSDSFPAVRPVFQSDFANGGRIDPRITFSRSDTPPTYAAPSAVHYWSNEKHLSSENLLTPSTPDSSWVLARLTPTYSQTGPYTGANATLHTEQATTNTAYIGSANYVTVANTSYTYSVWVKQNTGSRNYYQLRVGGLGSGVPFVTYHLSGAGSIDEFGGSYLDSYSITAGPTGWYKLTMTVTPTSASSSTYLFLCVGAPSGGELPSITGDTGNSFLVFGAQVSSTGETVLNETTTQLHREYAPTLKSVSTAGQPRFEYSPTDSASEAIGQSRGLLIEGQVTNVLPFSTNGYNASNAFVWSSNNIGATENAAIAPSGNLEATLIREDGTTNQHNFYRTITGTAAKYTYSIYVKDAGVGTIGFRMLGPTSYGLAFNLSDGSTSAFYNAVEGYGFEDVGNGWKRIWVTQTLTAAAWNMMIYLARGGVNYAGDNYSGVLWYGAQIEQSSFPSSYTDTGTSGSAVTRASDSASAPTADIGLTAGQDVTLYVEGDFGDPANKTNNRLAAALQENSNSYLLIYNGSANSGSGYVRDGGTDQAYFASGITVGAFKCAIAATNNSFKYAANGTSSTEDTAGTLPEYNTLRVGGQSVSGVELDGHIKRVAVYSQSLSSSELAALTK